MITTDLFQHPASVEISKFSQCPSDVEVRILIVFKSHLGINSRQKNKSAWSFYINVQLYFRFSSVNKIQKYGDPTLFIFPLGPDPGSPGRSFLYFWTFSSLYLCIYYLFYDELFFSLKLILIMILARAPTPTLMRFGKVNKIIHETLEISEHLRSQKSYRNSCCLLKWFSIHSDLTLLWSPESLSDLEGV